MPTNSCERVGAQVVGSRVHTRDRAHGSQAWTEAIIAINAGLACTDTRWDVVCSPAHTRIGGALTHLVDAGEVHLDDFETHQVCSDHPARVEVRWSAAGRDPALQLDQGSEAPGSMP